MKTKIIIETAKLILIGILLILNSRCHEKEEESSEIKDKDGNIYTSVTIGTQVWLKENLHTTKYNDGNDIPLGNLNSDPSTPRYWWYNDDQATYGDIYGALYNWYAVNTGKLCPTGWHVPSHSEWAMS